MQDHERQWLDHAWRVVDCPASHVAECVAAGGVGLPGSSGARFPGFVGRDYKPGIGVLCMGHVHRYLPDRDDVEGGRLAAIEAAIEAWRAGGRSPEADTEFLASSRDAYEASAPTWDYWRRNYQPLLDESRYSVREVAFANVAKCRTITEDDSAASVRLARICSIAFPPSELIAALRPAAVLLASLRLDVGERPGVTLLRWNGRTGVDDEGSTMKNWLPFRAGQLRRLRG